MSNYVALQSAIEGYVSAMKIAGKIVDADEAAIILSTKYPQSGMTIDEIVHDIQRAAAKFGAALLAGGRQRTGTDAPSPR